MQLSVSNLGNILFYSLFYRNHGFKSFTNLQDIYVNVSLTNSHLLEVLCCKRQVSTQKMTNPPHATLFPYTQEYKNQETTTKQYGGKDWKANKT